MRIEHNRPLRRPRCKWEDIIEMDTKKIVVSTQNWIDLARIGIIGEPL